MPAIPVFNDVVGDCPIVSQAYGTINRAGSHPGEFKILAPTGERLSCSRPRDSVRIIVQFDPPSGRKQPDSSFSSSIAAVPSEICAPVRPSNVVLCDDTLLVFKSAPVQNPASIPSCFPSGYVYRIDRGEWDQSFTIHQKFLVVPEEQQFSRNLQ